MNDGELTRRALRLNLDSYRDLLQVAASYARGCAHFWADVAAARPGGAASPVRAPVDGKVSAGHPPAALPALLLQGALGTVATARFRVKNDLPREVVADVALSPVVGADGKSLALVIESQPAHLTLAPGESADVSLTADITAKVLPGQTYRARLDIPGLAEQGIELVIRRSDEPPPPPAAKPARQARRKGRGRS